MIFRTKISLLLQVHSVYTFWQAYVSQHLLNYANITQPVLSVAVGYIETCTTCCLTYFPFQF